MHIHKSYPCFRTAALLLLSFVPLPIRAQQAIDYSVHANIIYHFTKYINWPANRKSGDFIIAVAGDSPLYAALRKNVAGKKVGNQKIVIQKVAASSSSFACHILFVPEEESSAMKKIISRSAGDPVLVVSEGEGLAGKGSCINFITTDHLKLEINKNNIEERHLDIASELLQLGKIIK